MSDVVEGIGGAIEGALAGRAVEPQRGEAADQKAAKGDTEHTCLNCGAYAPGNFCPQCGQKTHVHRTLSAIGHDLMHGVLHLDGKLWRTLPLLTFKPGQLTRRYIDGERASFVSPMAMFLFSVFAMFAVFQMVGITTPSTFDVGDPAEIVRDQGRAEAERIREEIAALPEGSEERQRRASDLETLEELLARSDEGTLTSGDVMAEMVASTQTEGGEASSEFLQGFADAISDEEGVDGEINLTGIESLDNGIIKKWRDNPGLMLYKLQANAYKFSWLLIPLSLPFVWLMFAWRWRFKAYDHAIFVTYSLSFMSLLFITMSLIAVSGPGAGWAFMLFAIGAPLHLYKHLKYTYGLSRFSTLWRFMALMIFINIILLLFLQALILLGAF